MTWQEYLDKMIEQGATLDLVQMSIGRMMDLYESWNWNDEVPFNVEKGE